MIRGAWVLVPVKDRAGAKSRLSPVLSPVERTALQRAMLLDLIDGLERSALLAGVALCGPDVATAELARRAGHLFIQEPASAIGLNAALAHGAEALRDHGARLIAVLPGDLPLADGTELDQAFAAVARSGRRAVVPDHAGEGTNGLVFARAAVPRFRFGPGSFRRHLAADREALPPRAMPLASFAFDIDAPADLARLGRQPCTPHGRRSRALAAALAERPAHPIQHGSLSDEHTADRALDRPTHQWREPH
ncbi:2-phospho-L-lactate guanylyltransferase [Aquibium sp. A9E412]|uniref:2-phospho-L-lactate guanylyltransferase n=1 Tax=Aquibium sp. A9E412 TaxID=2976767 RepID=UPI0025B1F2D0|nr:2-phospho-L-lactate guanylyltransferase [Aquibium sp. A9E412]MDN2567114.1 2-phospho-L-lactate guanylyltransferase [Aquibium sp. A9E412]